MQQFFTCWDEDIKDPKVLASQIIFLSDYVERLVDRSSYLLYQTNDIIDKILILKGEEINNEVVNYFISISDREEFWFDLIFPKLYQLLLYNVPYKNIEIDLDGIVLISELYKNIIDFKSKFTSTHTMGVSACAEKLSQFFGLTELETKLIEIGSGFHDIGKLAIPNSILEKPGRLTADEYAMIKSHTYYTYYILDSIGGLEQVAKWAAYHHEKLDGSGYPFHCKAEEIDTGSRIMAVADIFTAIFEDRPCRKGMHKDDIYRIIKTQSDKGFIDRRIVDILFDNYDSISEYVKQKQTLA